MEPAGTVTIWPTGREPEATIERVTPPILAAGYVQESNITRPNPVGDFWKRELGAGGLAMERIRLEGLAHALRVT